MAGTSNDFCDEIVGIRREAGVEITDRFIYLQSQLVAVHSAFNGFAVPQVRGDPKARQKWATGQMRLAAKASQPFGLTSNVTSSGKLAWPYLYPWPADRVPGPTLKKRRHLRPIMVDIIRGRTGFHWWPRKTKPNYHPEVVSDPILHAGSHPHHAHAVGCSVPDPR